MIYIPTTDAEYVEWCRANRGGFIVNSDKASSDDELPMLHTAECEHVTYPGWPGYVEKETYKLCSASKQELETWIKQTDNRVLRYCKSCAP